MRVIRLTVGSCVWVATAVGARAFGQAVTFDDGGFGPVTPGPTDGKAYKAESIATATQIRTDLGTVSFFPTLEPGGGTIFAIADLLSTRLKLTAPNTVRRGAKAVLDISVLDADGKPVDATVPFEIEILDPALRRAERLPCRRKTPVACGAGRDRAPMHLAGPRDGVDDQSAPDPIRAGGIDPRRSRLRSCLRSNGLCPRSP